jgi:prepilin-type N-terminal cleavage/methylation domain-containing protein
MTRRRQKGFSPIEVLIAMAILAIGIVGAFQLFPIALKQVRIAHERTVVTELAGSRISQLRTAGGRNLPFQWAPEAGQFNLGFEPFDAANSAYAAYAVYSAYTTTVQRMVAASEVYLHRVVVTVNMYDGRKESFVTYVSEP